MNEINGSEIYRPIPFFVLVAFFSWVPWMIAVYFSYLPGRQITTGILCLAGLLGPCLAALVMIGVMSAHNRRTHIRGIKNRLFNGLFSKKLWMVLVLVLFALLLATWLSIQLGHNPDQFQFQVAEKLVPMFLLGFIASVLEEAGWRTYGVDSIKERSGMWQTIMIFGLLWGLWHTPLFFINQTYQHGLRTLGTGYVLNYFISIIPAAILSNWLYYKLNRSIIATVLFHFSLNATAELLQTEPLTKCLIAGILVGVCLVLVVTDKAFFFGNSKTYSTVHLA